LRQRIALGAWLASRVVVNNAIVDLRRNSLPVVYVLLGSGSVIAAVFI
jgi:hypothetical protein